MTPTFMQTVIRILKQAPTKLCLNLRGWAGWGECSKELKSNYEVFLSGAQFTTQGTRPQPLFREIILFSNSLHKFRSNGIRQ